MDPREKLKYKALWNDILKKTEIIAKSNEDCSYDEYLTFLNITEESYLLALRSTIKAPTVFLRRDVSERKMNNYNKEILLLWGANMDIQFILSPYGLC